MTSVKRRRGAALENAILDAAWEEMVRNGFSNLTMEAVSARAGTSRPVLLRRWPDRGAIATAAIRHFLAINPISVPELGSFRSEFISYVTKNMNRGMPALIRIGVQMIDHFQANNSTAEELRSRILGDEEKLLHRIFERGIASGEVDRARLTPRKMTLVQDIVRHELLMTQEPVSDEAIVELIDDVLLPLVRP